eukprot:m.180288 g.180288  ORF g.180288 m.180288 type:complete len:1472 (+) comp39243_c0_seq11:859-5274(+)
MNLKQGSHETATAYNSRFRRTHLQLVNAMPGALPDATLVTWFQEGLRVEFRPELEREMPDTLAAAMTCAEKAERIWKTQQTSSSSNEIFSVQSAATVPEPKAAKNGETAGLLQQIIQQQSDMMGQFMKVMQGQTMPPQMPKSSMQPDPNSSRHQQNPNLRPPSLFCQYCKKPGHSKQECRKLLAKERERQQASQPQQFQQPYQFPQQPQPPQPYQPQSLPSQYQSSTPAQFHFPQFQFQPNAIYPGQSLPQPGYPQQFAPLAQTVSSTHPVTSFAYPQQYSSTIPQQMYSQPSMFAPAPPQNPPTQTVAVTQPMTQQQNPTPLPTSVPQSQPPRSVHNPTMNTIATVKPSGDTETSSDGPAEPSPIATDSSKMIPSCTIMVDGAEPVICVLDSGAVASVVSDEFLQQLGKPFQPAPLNKAGLVAANGGPLEILGHLDLDLAVGSYRSSHPFEVVKDFAYPVLLGSDFLKKSQAILDYSQGTVTIGSSPNKTKLSILGLFAEKDGSVPVNLASTPGRVCAVTCSMMIPAVFSLQHIQLCQEEPRQVEDDHHSPEEEDQPSESSEHSNQGNLSEPAWKPSQLVHLSPSLPDEEKRQLSVLVNAYADIFASSSTDLGRMPNVFHRIDTGDNYPVNQQPYRTSPAKQQEVERQIASMLDTGVIQESRSPWASPVVLVDKKDGSMRFCVDYQKLNHITKKDRYPLPRVDDSLDLLAGNEYFSSLDMQSGYWQIPVTPEDVEKTAFITPVGLFEFLVMPFGLCNAPSSFQRAMDSLLAGLKWQRCLVYLDDVLVFSKDFQSHLTDLDLVFNRFRENNLKLKPSKCHLAQTELRYLGYIISSKGVSADPQKIHAIQSLVPPTTKSLLRSFLGLTSYYRRFVPRYATVAEPLTNLLKDENTFTWSATQQEAFDALKQCLCVAPVLNHPDWSRPFLLQTDASDYAVAAILAQCDDDSTERVLDYGSRKLSDREKRWDTREKELWAVVWGCERYEKYLADRPFTIETDHANLRWLFGCTKLNNRLHRWVLRLQGFDFDIRHKAGKSHTNVDALSRLPTVQDENNTTESSVLMLTGPTVILPDQDQLRAKQQEDPLLEAVLLYLKHPGQEPPPPEVKDFLRDSGTFSIDSGTSLLMYESVLNGRRLYIPVLPTSCRSAVLKVLHALPLSGHMGYRKTYFKVRSQFYWKGLAADVKSFVRSCLECQARKTPQPTKAGELQLFSASKPFEVVGIDICGPLPRTVSGNRYIVVIVDRFSRWVELAAVSDITAPTVADVVVDKIVLRHGCPAQLLSDRGTQFTSQLFKRMSTRLGFKKVFTSPYHPQTNGQVERMNRYIAAALTAYVNDHQDNWDEYLEAIAFGYRTSVVDAIGNTPFYLVHGRDPSLPTDVFTGSQRSLSTDAKKYGLALTQKIKDAYAAAKSRQDRADALRKRAYDASHHPVQFDVGSLVLLHSNVRKPGLSYKLARHYGGPYRVIQQTSEVNY